MSCCLSRKNTKTWLQSPQSKCTIFCHGVTYKSWTLHKNLPLQLHTMMKPSFNHPHSWGVGQKKNGAWKEFYDLESKPISNQHWKKPWLFEQLWQKKLIEDLGLPFHIISWAIASFRNNQGLFFHSPKWPKLPGCPDFFHSCVLTHSKILSMRF